jgi:hypothetical protein
MPRTAIVSTAPAPRTPIPDALAGTRRREISNPVVHDAPRLFQAEVEAKRRERAGKVGNDPRVDALEARIASQGAKIEQLGDAVTKLVEALTVSK